MQRFKERLVSRRNALGWSQIDLAANSGVSARAIAGYEAEGTQPGAAVLDKLSKSLGVSVVWLLGGEDAPTLKDAEKIRVAESNTNSPYSWMETTTLQKTLIDLAARLPKAMPLDRKHIIGNLLEAVNELEAREINSTVNAGTSRLLQKVSDEIKTDALK